MCHHHRSVAVERGAGGVTLNDGDDDDTDDEKTQDRGGVGRNRCRSSGKWGGGEVVKQTG